MKLPSRSHGWFVKASKRQVTGVALKDESGTGWPPRLRQLAGPLSHLHRVWQIERLDAHFRDPDADLPHPARLPDGVRACKTAPVNFPA